MAAASSSSLPQSGVHTRLLHAGDASRVHGETNTAASGDNIIFISSPGLVSHSRTLMLRIGKTYPATILLMCRLMGIRSDVSLV
ncbi:hypothetical protein EYF80_049651 [Liparis tanakae]|uniref:Uncharacterized protein n=1 Tax=Liparis tanakae TaxID=230148 RepID=A0A4Z2FG34_9TELE|nr:hypothetical protein EYF80_049651 [Liparis tanakae]